MDLFDLAAKITLDTSEYEKGIDGAGKKASVFGDILKADLVTKGFELAAKGVAKLAESFSDMVKQSVESYADFEQLSGGVSKLFGEDSAAVMENASKAYKTAGLNANQYMETVTSFSASLISGLEGDTEEAARIADMAVVDMADNANTFGTSIESIQNAYQGFAKGNFTMLDNLKLGYGGTASERARLINESGVWKGEFTATAENVKDIPFDIMIQAIHKTQEEMNIAGTTAKESMFTISGSVGAAKSAWANLVTGIADENADLDGLINDFLETIIGVDGKGGVINNILPVAEKALNGISTLISTVAPTLIPLAVDIIMQNLPTILQAGTQILVALITGLATALPDLIRAIPVIITTLVTGLRDAWPEIKAAGADLLNVVGDGIKSVWQRAKSWGSDMIQLFINGIREKANALWEEVKSIASGIASFLHFSVPEKGPLSDLDESPKDMMQMYASGIRKNQHLVTDALNSSFNFDAPTLTAGPVAFEQAEKTAGNVYNITVNVDGADAEDDRSLAQRIAYEIKSMFDEEAAAIA